jgi:hypothetical protein
MSKCRVVNPFKNAEEMRKAKVKPKEIIEKVDANGDIIFDPQVLDGIDHMLEMKELAKQKKKRKRTKKSRVTKVESVPTIHGD